MSLVPTLNGAVMEQPIETEYVYPPIPDRRFDWSAVRHGYDIGDPIGRGPTEQDAIDDLLNWEADRLGPTSKGDHSK